MISDADGEAAVRAARKVLEWQVRGGEPPSLNLPPMFSNKMGIFVTLTTHPDDDLRGCIGYPEPLIPLSEGLKDSTVSACSRDPRFPPVTSSELGNVKIEVSILTPPEEVAIDKRADLPRLVNVGEDGLIVQKGWARGLLLPQVPVEWGWDSEEFLSQTCMKAGLPPDAWLDDDTRVYKFTAEIFSEDAPGGRIRRKTLSG